jgi:hypothetical protein
MTDFDAFREEMLAKPEVKAEYDALQPEFERIRATAEKGEATGE